MPRIGPRSRQGCLSFAVEKRLRSPLHCVVLFLMASLPKEIAFTICQDSAFRRNDKWYGLFQDSVTTRKEGLPLEVKASVGKLDRNFGFNNCVYKIPPPFNMLTTYNPQFRNLHWWRANARNVSFWIALRWPIYAINLVENPNFPCTSGVVLNFRIFSNFLDFNYKMVNTLQLKRWTLQASV